jgi:hypothetical protein
MTKAKLILSGIAFFAIIGGAVAFKAARTPQPFFGTAVAGGPCNVAKNINYTTSTTLTAPILTTTLTYYSIASTTDTFCSVLVRAVD